ncbi:hypothetical protein B296_00051146, partial [Ensete ventricosum]
RGCMLSPLPIQVVSWSKRLLHPSLCLVAANEITRKGKGIEEEKAVDYLPFTSSGRRRASGSRLEMETSQQSPDRIVIDNYLIFYQPPSAKDEKVMTSNATHDTNSMDVSADSQGHLDSSDAVSGYSTVYPPNFFAPQAHSFFFRGHIFILLSNYIQASQQQRSLYGFGTSANSIDRAYPPRWLYHGSTYEASFSSSGIKDQSLIDADRSRSRGKGTLYNRNGTLDFLNEQNRGPRANRLKNQMTEHNSSLDNENGSSTAVVDRKLYNSADFVTEYKDAKFFIIKSYSEDNVHKSIKYGVWASTSNGNKKLDSAYHEAKKKEDPCPVNASAHFCGVAEMIGPVDFERSVDYWQQDKWSGQFPLKWHMVKDVPNNLFRHIILENNENKPVTNSRDTQEVSFSF